MNTRADIRPTLPPIPANESERVAALRRFELLDTPPEPLFDQVVRLAAKLFGVPIALVSLVAEDRQWFKARIGFAAHETPRNDAFCAHAINGDGLFVVEDAARDPRFAHNPLVTGEHGVRFYAGAPLRTRDGHALGTICVIDRQPHGPLSPEQEETLRDLSALVMAHIEARQSVGYLSPVTGLSNRFRFIDDMDAFIAEHTGTSSSIATVMVATATPQEYADLARALGHTYAAAFEMASAQRIQQIVPTRIKLYHISTTRFCFVVSASDRTEVDRLAVELASGLRRLPLQCGDIPISTTRAVGVAHYPGDGGDSGELLRAVTSAVLYALDNRIALAGYRSEEDLRWQRGFRLLTDLPVAIGTPDQLHLHYQPKIDLTTGHCCGAEALLRWTHPDLGPIPPGEFIPLTERTALMRPLTEWVLAAAFRQVAEWRRDGFLVPISVNISMLDLEFEAFPGTLAALLDRYGVQPHWIDVEITESALMRNQAQVSRQLAEIRALGIEIAIDDFGTGQSALSYLKYIPANVVKIDQTFIRTLCGDIKDQHIVRSTIDLAHDLGCRVIAEGVETETVLAWLAQQGCDIGQGYFMSRPLEPIAFRRWVEERNG